MSKMADNALGFTTIDDGICNICSRVKDNGQICLAFLQGIPAIILTGEHDHHLPFPGDNGIQFKAKE